MDITRLRLRTGARVVAVMLIISPFVHTGRTQSLAGDAPLKPDVRRALRTRTREAVLKSRKEGYTPKQSKALLSERPSRAQTESRANPEAQQTLRRPARVIRNKSAKAEAIQPE